MSLLFSIVSGVLAWAAFAVMIVLIVCYRRIKAGSPWEYPPAPIPEPSTPPLAADGGHDRFDKKAAAELARRCEQLEPEFVDAPQFEQLAGLYLIPDDHLSGSADV